MKNLICNNVIAVGAFCGPEIEEGTFHYFDIDSLNLHQNGDKKCPCPPVESPEAKASDDSNEDNEKDNSEKD